MIVDEADGLHPRINDDGADEFDATVLEFFGNSFGERRTSWNGTGVLNRLAVNEAPYPV